MPSKATAIIEFPSNLGLKALVPGREPGVNKLPDWLRRHGFHQLLAPDAVRTLQAPAYSGEVDGETGVLHANVIVQYAKEQAVVLHNVFAAQQFPLVLGGDCSILLGSVLALKQRGKFALCYLDGHTDFIAPEHSGTGAVGGMAAGVAAGLGPEKLTNIKGLLPYVKEEHVWCIGNREYDEAYEAVIQHSQATYISLELLRAQGILSCVRAFLHMVEQQGLDGFWIHIDVDVLDDALMPAVDSRTPDGLSYEEFDQLVGLLLSSLKACGMEITILDPDLDPSGQYTSAFVHHMTTTFLEARGRM